MEYLMTYGWSILIIAVVVAALFSLGVFNAGAGGGASSCIGVAGYQCSSPVLSTTGTLSATLGQIGQTITVNAIACTNSTGSPQWQPLSSSVTLGSTQTSSFSFSCPSAGLGTLGSKFMGYLWIGYSAQGQYIKVRIGQVKLAATTVSTPYNTIWLWTAQRQLELVAQLIL